tara:strand:- start:7417 stop:8280 length:864 start_codon:yes stop_codon:yes gene_type:complete
MVYYLILGAHEQYRIVSLIKMLDCEEVGFIVHIDSDYELKEDLIGLSESRPNIHILTERVSCNWSGLTLVKAMLILLNKVESLSGAHGADIYQFLSGSCWPLHSAEECRDLLVKQGTNVHCWGKMGDCKESDIHLNGRFVRKVWLFDIKMMNFRNYKSKIFSSAIRNLVRGLHLVLSTVVTINKEFLFYKGSQWFSITTADWKSVDKNLIQEKLDQLKWAKAPDEVFFQSIFSASNIGLCLQRKNLYANHYIDWSNPRLGPVTYDRDEIAVLSKNEKDCIFIRKVKL